MRKIIHLPIIVLGLLSLSSCALPPREAWRVIQHDGLFPYIAVEMGRKPVPRYVMLPTVTGSRFVRMTPSAKAPGPVRVGGDVYVKRPLHVLSLNSYLDAGRSAPLRSGPVAIAPKPAPRPAPPAVQVKPRPVVVVARKPEPRPAPGAPVVQETKPVERKVVAVTPKPPDPAAVKPRPTPDKPMPSTPTTSPTPATAPTKPAADSVVKIRPLNGEMPFGSPIPGRPGLVNSPFAGKFQLVDVTGLSPGQEVKCPYTGKLFRVPGMQQATNNTKLPTEPPSPPEKANDDKKP